MSNDRWTYVPFPEAVADQTACGNKLQQKFFQPHGKVPIVDQGAKAVAGYSDDTKLAWKQSLPVVIFGDHTRAIKYVDYPFILGADGTKVLVPRNGLTPKFLYYYLHKVNLPSQGYARHFSHLKRIEVPVPPLAEQERIVALLDEADELRKLRAQADRRTADLIPALFHEMFGDPEHTDLPVKPLAELVLPDRPITYGILKPGPDIEGGIPYVRVLDIKQNRLHVHQLVRTSKAIAAQYKRSTLRSGDVLVSIRGTVGRTCIVPLELDGANITQDTARLAIISSVESTYVVEFINTPWAQHWMGRRILGQAVKGINLGDLRKLPVPVPPLPLQQEFAQRVTGIRAMEAEQAISRQRLDDLFQSMLHRAFAGAL